MDDDVGIVQGKRLVTLADGTRAIWKPSDVGSGKQWREPFSPGHMVGREVGAWEVAKLVGMTDLVPPTVARDVGHGDGSLQEWVPGDIAMASREPYDGERDSTRAAVFDFVIGNEDRHTGNWIVDGAKLRLIDHGFSFPEKEDVVPYYPPGARFVMRTEDALFESPKVVEYAREAAKPYLARKDEILAKLRELKLPKAAIKIVERRIDSLRHIGPGWPREAGI